MKIALISPRTTFASNNSVLNEFWAQSPDLIDIHVRSISSSELPRGVSVGSARDGATQRGASGDRAAAAATAS